MTRRGFVRGSSRDEHAGFQTNSKVTLKRGYEDLEWLIKQCGFLIFVVL
jgi:hypothetical protein